jgi:hypothetical protein
MAIYLDDYRKARALKLPARRSDEKLPCMNRNPAYGAVACFKTPQELSPHLPDNFVGPDVSALMLRARALASQI